MSFKHLYCFDIFS